MKILWTAEAWEQYTSWDDRRMIRRINALIRDIARGEDGGLGKPELLRGELGGWSSRRIDQEHRLVYRIWRGDQIEILSCRYHYSN